MGRSKQRKWLQKAIAIALALTVGVTFMPMFGGSVWGAEKAQKVAGDELVMDVDDPAIKEYMEIQNAVDITTPEFGLEALGVPSTEPDPDNAAQLESDQGKNASHESTEANYGGSAKVMHKPLYNRPSQYTVYSRYLIYNVGTNLPRYYDDWGIDSYDLYMQYRVRGGKWKMAGPMSGYTAQSYKLSGLRPNTVYQVRTFYGLGSKSNGTFRSGLATGRTSAVVTLKTGKNKKPRIKSMKVKAFKVKKHKESYWSYYWGILRYHKVKYYTCKVKVTVKMRKKTGARYVYLSDGIKGKYAKGNKKKYKAIFGPYTTAKKPTKYKFTLYMLSLQNKNYGGYSPILKKTKKVR